MFPIVRTPDTWEVAGFAVAIDGGFFQGPGRDACFPQSRSAGGGENPEEGLQSDAVGEIEKLLGNSPAIFAGGWLRVFPVNRETHVLNAGSCHFPDEIMEIIRDLIISKGAKRRESEGEIRLIRGIVSELSPFRITRGMNGHCAVGCPGRRLRKAFKDEGPGTGRWTRRN